MTTSITLTTKEAWESPRPISTRLPTTYQVLLNDLGEIAGDNSLVLNLMRYWDTLYRDSYLGAKDLFRQVDPVLCDPTWLDLLGNFSGFNGIWRKGWTERTKRLYCANAYGTDDRLTTARGTLLGIEGGLWANKGTIQAIQWAIDALGVLCDVEVDGDFIIGQSEVGDPIGYLPWSIRLVVPESYQASRRLRQIEYVLGFTKPAWVRSRFVFDPNRFTIQVLLSSGLDLLVNELDAAYLLSLLEEQV